MADVAFGLLHALGSARPVHARQLAAMAIKRKLAYGDPDELWRSVKLALLSDVRARQARGERPRVRHQGGGVFTLAAAELEAELVKCEMTLAECARVLSEETHSIMRKRVVALPQAAFERLAATFLERIGYVILEPPTDVSRYYLAQGSGDGRALVATYSGSEVPLTALGNLRAEVGKRKLDRGLVIAAGALGTERDVDASGAPITIYEGDNLILELMRLGVGVAKAYMPISYLDGDFFAELL